MNSFFAFVEQWPLSIWMREDYYAYFVALILHAFGMALLIGGGIVISLRLLGVGKDAPLDGFRRFFPVMWLGAALASVSGLLLLSAYPAKALTNPMFAIKFICLIAATLLVRKLARQDQSRPSRLIAAIALALWLGGVAAGKLLLHTYTILTVT